MLIVAARLQLNRIKKVGLFMLLYGIAVFVVVPPLAQAFNKVKINNSTNLKPATWLTVLLNRDYVTPQLHAVLQRTAKRMPVVYLDACFPFFDGFPLLPHLSHNDGRKIDLSFVYVDPNGERKQTTKSVTGYGVFEAPQSGEVDQPEICKNKGYWQYNLAQYLTLGKVNSELVFSEEQTRQLIQLVLQEDAIQKVFLEPHLVKRLHISHSKMRYHGCYAVRHDDHIHIQVK
jgi:hypothetical protein